MFSYKIKTCRGDLIRCSVDQNAFFANDQINNESENVILIDFGDGNGLLLPEKNASAARAAPVRFRDLGSGFMVTEARFGQKERIFSALPAESGNEVLPVRDVVGEWETFQLLPTAFDPPWDMSLIREILEASGDADRLLAILSAFDRDVVVLRIALCLLEVQAIQALCRLICDNAHMPAIGSLSEVFENSQYREGYLSLIEWLGPKRRQADQRKVLGKEFDHLAAWPSLNTTFDQALTSILRSQVNPRKDICIVASSRNEGAYMLEWLAYHFSINVERIFLYTNDNQDMTLNLLRGVAAGGRLTYIENETGSVPSQYKAYSHSLTFLNEVLDYRWALYIDLDEFFVFDKCKYNSIVDYFSRSEASKAQAIAFHWVMFNIFGQHKADLSTPITERNTKRIAGPNTLIKSACRPRYFEHSHAHYPFSAGDAEFDFRSADGSPYQHAHHERAHSTAPTEGHARVHHYWAKSSEEMIAKLFRNSGDREVGWSRPLAEIHTTYTDIIRWDPTYTAVEDRSACDEASSVRSIMSDLMQIPGVREAHERSIAHQQAAIASANAAYSAYVESL